MRFHRICFRFSQLIQKGDQTFLFDPNSSQKKKKKCAILFFINMKSTIIYSGFISLYTCAYMQRIAND